MKNYALAAKKVTICAYLAFLLPSYATCLICSPVDAKLVLCLAISINRVKLVSVQHPFIYISKPTDACGISYKFKSWAMVLNATFSCIIKVWFGELVLESN